MANASTLIQAYLKTEAYGYAIADATKAIELNPSFVKVRRHLLPLDGGIPVLRLTSPFRLITAAALPTPLVYGRKMPPRTSRHAARSTPQTRMPRSS